MSSKYILAGILSVISWGTVFIFAQIGVQQGSCPPIMLSLIRFLSVSAFFIIYALLFGIKLHIQKRDVPVFLLLGFFGIFGMNVLVFYSLKYTSSTTSSILMNANPIFIGLMAGFVLKEKITGIDILGLLLGFFGCYLTIYQGKFSGISLGGGMLALSAALCWAIYTIMAKKTDVINKYGPVSATFWPCVFGSIMMLLTLFLLKIPFTATKTGWLVGLYLGLIPTGVGFTLWFFALQKLRTVAVGVLQFLAPLTTGVIAFCWLNEKISGYTAAGGVFILIGALLPFLPFAQSRH